MINKITPSVDIIIGRKTLEPTNQHSKKEPKVFDLSNNKIFLGTSVFYNALTPPSLVTIASEL